MASSDSWLREFNEASRLADDINAMISERGSLPPSGPDTQRHSSATRRKITILGTRLDSLESLLSKLPLKQHMYMATLKVGDGNTDHYCWQRPEDMTTDRHAYRIDTNNTGLDLA